GILCDPDRLTQALRNLLANARRHAGLDGSVSCTLAETPEWLTFTVRDSGPGLPPELGERIFDPFVSGAGSSGLGLSVSRQIAVMHGGNLTGGNHLDAGGQVAGAEFVLTVPGAALGEDEDDEVLEDVEPVGV
ncbi:MAG TPA: sensor histidine kinase, partial [Deinococcus radiodurans]|nr:sensor histidine kinase [Deinococcus radiodurans]